MRNTFYQKKKAFNKRFIALICVLALVMGAFCVKLGEMQIVNAEKYLAQGDTSSSRIQTVTAARGEIVDRYGRVLVYNRSGFNIEFDAAYLPKSKLNPTVLKLTSLMSSTGDTWRDDLPMEKQAPYSFTEGSFDAAATLRSTLGLARYATAQNCFDAMVTRYKLEGMRESDQRTIMGVRWSMERADYSVSAPFTFSEDVGDKIIAVIKESSFEFEGVNIVSATFREYTDPTLAPHILGYTGLMSESEWAKVKDSGDYQMNGKIGKAGIEKAAESMLKGTDGKIKITTDANGKVLSTETVAEQVPGSSVQITIDSKLQKVAQEALNSAITKINAEAEYGKTSTGGALAVIEVKSGEVLAAANWPSYSMDDLFNNYSDLLRAANNPLFDRSLNGTYPPGSTFKPAVALIGLETGKITAGETINCVHKYKRFEDFQPSCLGTHGRLTVSRALAKSCNYFFYEVGYRVGIDTLNKYSRQLGFGVATGVELPESTGTLAGKEERKKRNQIWNPGDTIQAAIGQSDNLFTPMQMAVFTATVASGGTRYKAHFVKGVYDYSMSELQQSDFTEVLDRVEISDETFNVVREGMLQVTENGTATSTFGRYSIKVAGKTGTADAPNKTNAMFIAFAPYDDPQIAIAIAVENGGHGSAIAPVAKEIFDAYFFNSSEPYSGQQTNTLLK